MEATIFTGWVYGSAVAQCLEDMGNFRFHFDCTYHLSLLQKDGFVIPEVVIGNPVLGKSKSYGFPLTRE